MHFSFHSSLMLLPRLEQGRETNLSEGCLKSAQWVGDSADTGTFLCGGPEPSRIFLNVPGLVMGDRSEGSGQI